MDGEAKKRRGWRPVLFFSAVLVLAAVALVLAGTGWFRRTDPARAEVIQILQSTNRNRPEQIRRMTALGSKALPTLSELIAYHESRLHARYRKLQPSLPVSLRKHLPDPLEYQRLHVAAIQIVYDLGPVFIRPLTPALCKVRDESMLNNVIATACLYWSIPDSPEAVARMVQLVSDPTNELSSPPQGMDGFWSRLPQTAPAFAARLKNQSNAVPVTTPLNALGMMGTNAAPALPAIIGLCRREPPPPGSPPPNVPTNLPAFVTPAMMAAGVVLRLEQDRGLAFRALGKIGIPSEAVLDTLKYGLADTNETIRFAALAAWRDLRQPLGTNLTGFLNGVTPLAIGRFADWVQWVGTLGPDGREALPWLRRFTVPEYVQSLSTTDPQASPAPSSTNAQRTAEMAAVIGEHLQRTAVVAVCRVDPDEIVHYLPDLASLITRTEVVEMLAADKTHAAEITAALEPALTGPNPIPAARIVLSLAPGHPQAKEALRSRIGEGPMNEQIAAAATWWKVTGESRDVLAVADDGLGSTQANIALAAITALKDLGPAARPAIPALKAALLHPETRVRQRAGILLWQLAPEEMPPVH